MDDPTVADGHTVANTLIVAGAQAPVRGLCLLDVNNQPPSGCPQGGLHEEINIIT